MIQLHISPLRSLLTWLRFTGCEIFRKWLPATKRGTKTSKVPTRVALLLISYSVAVLLVSQFPVNTPNPWENPWRAPYYISNYTMHGLVTTFPMFRNELHQGSTSMYRALEVFSEHIKIPWSCPCELVSAKPYYPRSSEKPHTQLFQVSRFSW